MRKPASFYFFKRKPIVLKDKYERWRGVADFLGFTTQERLRVEWIVFYYTAGKENAALTAQYFGLFQFRNNLTPIKQGDAWRQSFAASLKFLRRFRLSWRL